MSGVAGFLFEGTAYDTYQVDLSRSNYEAQKKLVQNLGDSFEACGRSVEDIAQITGFSQQEVLEMLEGARDLTLSELRKLAYALDTHVSYHVTARYTEVQRRFRDALGSDTPWADWMWEPAGDWSHA